MATVDIIVRMIDQTGGATNKTIANLKSMAGSLATVGAVAGVAAVALKKTYDIGKEGAALQLTTDRFDRLSEAIGTTSDALLDDLREATRGLYSDMELMTSATDFMSLGLAKSHDEAVRLAAVSSGLNMNMNQLVLTLTNMTTMRFDALGVQVDGFKEKVKELEAQGYSTEAAFKEAFLQQAENQLEKVGHAADSTAGEFMRLESVLKNTADEWKKSVSDGLTPVIKGMNDAISSAQDYYRVLEDVAEAHDMTTRELRMMRGEGDELIAQYQRAEQYGKAWASALGDVAVAVSDVAQVTQENLKANQEMLDLIGKLSDEEAEYNKAMEDSSESIKEAEAKLDELIKTRYWDTAAIDEQKSKIDELREKRNEETDEYELNTKRRILSMVEEKLAVGGLEEAEMQYLEELGLQWGIYTDSAVEAARETRAQVDDIVDAFNSLPDGKTISLRLETVGGFSLGALSREEGIYSQEGIKRKRGFATGGSFVIPQQYGYEGFNMGGMATASGGETVTITPGSGGGNNNADLISAIQSNRIDEKSLARAIVAAMAQAG